MIGHRCQRCPSSSGSNRIRFVRLFEVTLIPGGGPLLVIELLLLLLLLLLVSGAIALLPSLPSFDTIPSFIVSKTVLF